MRRIPYAFALALLSAPAMATAPQQEPSASSAPEAGDAEARRRMLNAQQAELARRQAADNAANARHYDAQVVGAELEAEHNASAYARTLQQHDSAVETQDRSQAMGSQEQRLLGWRRRQMPRRAAGSLARGLTPGALHRSSH